MKKGLVSLIVVMAALFVALAVSSGGVYANTTTADAGPDVSVLLDGSAVELNGIGSSTDDPPLSFAWSFSSRPPGSAAVLLNSNTAAPSFTPDALGDYVVQLTVFDNLGGSATDTVTITVPITVQTVTQALGILKQDIIDLGPFPAGFVHSLTQKLDRVVGRLADGKFQLASNHMNAFVNHFKAQEGKKLTGGQVAAMSANAEAILAAIRGL